MRTSLDDDQLCLAAGEEGARGVETTFTPKTLNRKLDFVLI